MGWLFLPFVFGTGFVAGALAMVWAFALGVESVRPGATRPRLRAIDGGRR